MPQESVTAFIVDDEFQSREVISMMLAAMFREIKIVGLAANVKEALAGIERKKQRQLVFLQ